MDGLATYAATQGDNTIQHYYAGLMNSKPKRKEKNMACKKKKSGGTKKK